MISKSINISGKLIDLSQPKIMGIINVTPDSFYTKSRVRKLDDILVVADSMIKDGASFLDIGGYSTRPGAKAISEKKELSRIIDPIKEIAKMHPDIIISIDTFRSNVAEEAIKSGAKIINDVSGGQLDPRMIDFAAESGVPYIAMHMKGTPENMTKMDQYQDLVKDIVAYFSVLIDKFIKRGGVDIIIDPGFGFAKNNNQNFELLSKLEILKLLEKPILVGISRKSMIYKALKITPEEALNGTTVLNTLALLKGANILRVHDVRPAMEAIKLLNKTFNW